MKKNRHLDGKGKGEFSYDYKYDILTFKVKDRDYKMSFEFQNFEIFVDTNDYITGIRIFDISKVFDIDKVAFQNMVQGEFNASIEDNIITVRFKFVGKMRNKLFPIFKEKENFTQQFTAEVNPKNPMKDNIVTKGIEI